MADRSYLAWPFFEPIHRELQERLERWLDARRGELTDEDGGIDESCIRLVRLLGAAGWLKHVAPKSERGRGRLDVRVLCLLREHLAYLSGLADFAFAMQGLGSGPISLFGTARQRKRYVARAATGQAIAAFALSEKEAGSDVGAIATSAAADGDGYVLNGEKTWISNGGIADFYVVFARTGEAPGTKGLSAFIVEAGDLGVEVAERIEVIAPHPLATLRFSDCRIPGDRLVGERGDGFKIAMATLDVFRSTVGAAALGFARRAMDEAMARAQERQLFGAPLSQLQLTQGAIAEMALDVDSSALLVYRSAWTKDVTGERVTREAALAKWAATEAAQRVIDRAVQLFGGQGIVSGTPVERLYREVRALRIYEGASEVQQVIVARQELARLTRQYGD